MDFSQAPQVAFSDLPIVLLPDDDEIEMRAGIGLELDTRPKVEEPPRAPAPQHPIPSMQHAFAESLVEATGADAENKPKLRTGDAKARREELLDQASSDPPPTALWRGRPGQKEHELCRLIAQISFGVYLLLHGMANSQTLVVSILQGHIDEVDEFLETTVEDIELATRDMEDRIKHLKLPMDNIGVFEKMLEDRQFRTQILEGNQKIEHILARTQAALDQTTRDLSEGLGATRDFTIYLAEQQHGNWRRDRPDVIDIFDAMKGNTDGWFNAFMDLQAKAGSLNTLMVRLTDMVSEMERRAAEVSRKTRLSLQPHSPKHSPRLSDTSSVTTPPTSPLPKITTSPPRLSLRLSTLKTVDLSIDVTEANLSVRKDSVHELPSGDGLSAPLSPLIVTSRSPPPENSPPESPIVHGQHIQQIPTSPPARNPRRVSKRPSVLLDLPKLEVSKQPEGSLEEEVKEGENTQEETLYILQPKTYTPQATPQPSPRVAERPKSKQETLRPRQASLASSTSSVESAAQVTIQPTKPQAHQLKIVEIGARTSMIRNSSRMSQRPDSRPMLGLDHPPQPPQLTIPQQPAAVPTPRASLRQRLSLKTGPLESIQVPPPHGGALHRPLQTAPRLSQAPDSAYASDMERPPVHSMASINSSMVDFSPPFAHPGMIPSPHSERQFFRPVQASPYSPLQQRPHTAGTVDPHRFPPPPRHTPSAMGMSMMSSATGMTGKTSKSVKKKRSAFGWLKKAFALDEEERATFEQRRVEQNSNNPYYEPKSQEFLDGKRVRPRPAY
ncbi:uncharacterized protein C8A04DRAFT_30521 [Dichotomopilus funicola]|uniref:Uncharacterized protein n=1 Tax=Dichotomopilus funicola TaxID=1934379 RepID=A0AAN6ZJR3_9PEZI|nr:hypothetical protein C8A04DRAFT_30521 [Dichotomopilus funicola]